MYVFQYDFYPKDNNSEFLDQYREKVIDFMASLFQSGQIAENYLIVDANTGIKVVLETLETTSLDSKYISEYGKKNYNEILDLSKQEPIYKLPM